MRIIAMLFIIAHHSVVNSGITSFYDFNNVTLNMIFLQFWGMWGKTAINVFVLITGYFMCTSKLTWQRFTKIWFKSKFYKIALFIIFVFAGYETLNLESVLHVIFNNLYGINNGFTSSFLAFYLFIPFLNMIINRFDRKELRNLLMLLLGIFVGCSTLFNSSVFNYIFWYVTLYFVAAYIRLYPNKLTEDKRIYITILVVSLFLSYVSVLAVDFLGAQHGFTNAYYMFHDSNKLFAFTVGVSVFLLFKNMPERHNKVINKIASTTFGVLLIHANSDAMRKWLWKDLLNIPALYTLPLNKLIFAFVCVTLIVFVVCSLIDYCYISIIERPLFSFLNRYSSNIENISEKIKNKLDFI